VAGGSGYPPPGVGRVALGSWLNIVEIELNVLGRQCVGRRILDKPTLVGEVAAWEAQRNADQAKVNWRSTTAADARIKPKRRYPNLQAWQCISLSR